MQFLKRSIRCSEENFLTVNYNHSYTAELMPDSLLMKVDIDFRKVFRESV